MKSMPLPPKKPTIDVLVCVGHSRRGDKSGAVSVSGESEYSYNCKVGRLLLELLEKKGFKAQLLTDYPMKGYGAAMKWVGQQAYGFGAKIAVELHFNSAEKAAAAGHEWLYHSSSTKGLSLARCFERAMVARRPDASNRGLKKLFDDTDRGYAFVKCTPCPAVVLEPFFGSNAQESLELINQPQLLAEVYAEAIEQYLT